MKKIDIGKLTKWVPILIAGTIAVVQAIGEQKEGERIDNMEERIAKLEENEENEEE